MSNRLYFVVVMLVGLAVLVPLSQYFGGPVMSSGVEITRVDLADGQRVRITGAIQPDAMARMSFQWYAAQQQQGAAPAPLSEQVFFAMANPYGPGGKTPEFVAYTTADGQVIGVAQKALPDEVLILLNRKTGGTWPSQAVLDELGKKARGEAFDESKITGGAQAWLDRLHAEHPILKSELTLPPDRELVVPPGS